MNELSLHNLLIRHADEQHPFTIAHAVHMLERVNTFTMRGWLTRLHYAGLLDIHHNQPWDVHYDPDPQRTEHVAADQCAQKVWGR
jgi:hypothetical protein